MCVKREHRGGVLVQWGQAQSRMETDLGLQGPCETLGKFRFKKGTAKSLNRT